MCRNVGSIERVARLLVGIAVLGWGIATDNWWGSLGLLPLATGALGFCPVYGWRARSTEHGRSCAATFVLSIAVAGCAADEKHVAVTTDRLEPYTCGSVQRLHTYGGIFLASQPAATDFAQAKDGGVKTVIDLRHASEHGEFDERAHVEGLGLHYENVPWNGPDELTDAVFDRARALLNESERPILMHCSSANRVGAVWIPWRVLDDGASLEEAVAEARTIGLRSAEFEAKARSYVERRRP